MQLTQWRYFEEDQINPNQMAKYFSSPSKSQPSVYSQDEIYYLVGENNSMKKLLNEVLHRFKTVDFPSSASFASVLPLNVSSFLLNFQKNAVIDSLQEQVNNAKDKLLRLMSSPADPDVDSSDTNLNSSSTQTTEIQSDASLPHRDSRSRLSPLRLPAAVVTAPCEHPAAPDKPSAPRRDMHMAENQSTSSVSCNSDKNAAEFTRGEDGKQAVSHPSSGLLRTAEETVHFVTSLQCHKGINPFQVGAFDKHCALTSHIAPNARLTGFVSSEKLQEILQELSVDAVIDTTLRSPGQTGRTPSPLHCTDASTLSPLSLRKPRSAHPPVLHPRISPYAMRKRRPPFHSSRRGLTPPCFYTGCGKIRENCEQQNPREHPDRAAVDATLLRVRSEGLELDEDKEEDAERHGAIGKCQRCVSRAYKGSDRHCAEHDHTAPPDAKAGGDDKLRRRHIRDSCGYWDSDSSSSTDYCYYHRPYCESCLQRGSLLSSDSSSDSSDSEYEGFASLYRSPHPVVFKEDLKPTFV